MNDDWNLAKESILVLDLLDWIERHPLRPSAARAACAMGRALAAICADRKQLLNMIETACDEQQAALRAAPRRDLIAHMRERIARGELGTDAQLAAVAKTERFRKDLA